MDAPAGGAEDEVGIVAWVGDDDRGHRGWCVFTGGMCVRVLAIAAMGLGGVNDNGDNSRKNQALISCHESNTLHMVVWISHGMC